LRVTKIHTSALRDLLRRGLETAPTVRNIPEAVAELEDRLHDPDVALFIQEAGFLIAENNRSAFVNACVVIHFYAEAGDVLAGLLDECIQFAHDGGLRTFQGFDINGLSLRAYRRLLKGRARSVRALGVTYEVHV
jgi:hypothetical protein